jgi:hypothetical protein
MAEVTPLKRAIAARFSLAETMRRVFHHTAPAGTTIEDLLTPGYWSAIAKQVQALDRIEVIDDECGFYAELIVLSVDPVLGLRLRPLRGVELNGDVGPRGASPRNTAGVRAIYRGPHLRWCAVRGDDEVLRDKFRSEAECGRWIASHIATQEK